MSEETNVKLKCLKIAAEASSRIGQYTPSRVLEQAKGWYEWVKCSPLTDDRSPKEKEPMTATEVLKSKTGTYKETTGKMPHKGLKSSGKSSR